MANKLLLPVYKKVFGYDFSYKSFDDRLQMQKMVYLLQEEGINIGDYGFDWYKHGPYSQVLLDDMHLEDGTECIEIHYTKGVEDSLNQLKDIFHEEEAQEKYGMKNWTECLASIHFIKNKEMGSRASKEDVIRVLMNRKPHLDDKDLNNKAYDILENLSI